MWAIPLSRRKPCWLQSRSRTSIVARRAESPLARLLPVLMYVGPGVPLLAACDDKTTDGQSWRADDAGQSAEQSSEHAVQAHAASGTGHPACGQPYAADPRDATMTGELVRVVTGDSGTPDDPSDDPYEVLLPKEMTDWLMEQNWIQEHGDWHNIRRCDQKKLAGMLPPGATPMLPGANLSPIMSEDALSARGLKCAPIQESEPGDGYDFLVMHRHMIRGFMQAFPGHAGLLRGFGHVPLSKGDPENPIAWVDVKWNDDALNSIDWMVNIDAHAAAFASEDDYGKWVQLGDKSFGPPELTGGMLPPASADGGFRPNTGGMPAAPSAGGMAAAGGAGALPIPPVPVPGGANAGPAAADAGMSTRPNNGLHGSLHGQWNVRNSETPLADNNKNVRNFAFWRLHGWIDDMWERFRKARGLSESDADYQTALLTQCEEMHELGKAPPPPAEAAKPAVMESGKFATEIAPILSSACGGNICHGAEAPTLGLVLAEALPSAVRSGLVGKRSREHDMALVDPGNSDRSWLYRKVTGNFEGVDCKMASCSAMPLGGMGLSKDEIESIRRWIAEGATAD